MGIPQVVIVGRPNVGKSSIFNWLARKRLAIVDDTAGVTRDRVTYLMFDRDRYFELVDTGGIGFDDPDNLTDEDRRADRHGHRIGRRDAVRRRHADRADAARPGGRPPAALRRRAGDLRGQQGRRRRASTRQADEFYKLGRGKLICASTHAEPRPAAAAGHDRRAAAQGRRAREAPTPTSR